MNSHYIPCLLLKQFSNSDRDRVNSFDFKTQRFMTKKIKKTFAEKDLFDEDLEKAFAVHIEGPFGDLLNHKLLHENRIVINRQENFLMRKFIALNYLRAPIANKTYEEMIELTRLQDHPSVHMMEYYKKNVKGFQELFDEVMSFKKNYISSIVAYVKE